MAKNRRGGYRQPNNPAPVATPQGGQRTDGGAGSKTQPLRRLPDADYGDNQQFVNQQQGAPLPVASQVDVNPNVFAPTERPNEPVTSGLPFGPGLNTRPEEQIYQAENIKQFVYQSWLETGDDSLLEYL